MKRISIVALVVGCLALAIGPAAALARHGTSDERVSGTVQSFTNGTLTIKTADGMVSGVVTRRTEIQCERNANGARTSRARIADHGGSGDNSGSGDRGDRNDNDAADENDNDADDQGQPATPACGMASLTSGAVVNRARLRDRHHGGTGTPVFDQIKLAA
jgi:hypothetical protein